MTNSIYYSGAEYLVSGLLNANTKLGVAVLDKAYVFDAQTQVNLSDIEANVIGTASLDCFEQKGDRIYARNTNVKANTNCATPCLNFDQACSLVIYIEKCSFGMNTLIANITDQIFGLPLQYSGPELDITWDSAGIMANAPCSPGLVGVENTGGSTIVMSPDLTDPNLLDNFFIWFGAPRVDSRPLDIKLITPTFDNNGQVNCAVAKGFLAEVFQAEIALMQKKYVSWDGRAISFASIGEIQQLKRMWEHKVQSACNSGCKGGRRPISFSNLC